MCGFDLQTERKGYNSSNHATVPTHLQFFGFERKRSFDNLIDKGQNIDHDSPNYWHGSKDHQGHQNCSPLALDGQDGGPQVGKDKGLGNVTDCLEG